MTDNPARPGAGLVLCPLADIADPGGRGFEFRVGDALFLGFVVRKGPAVFGYVDHCPHAGWPLASGPDQYLTRDGRRILCSGHGALFVVEDGRCLAGPCADAHLEAWPVALDAQGVVRTA